jgi:hypothetical protein
MRQNKTYLERLFTWERPLIYRGNSELKPKNIDIVKSLVSLIRSMNLGPEDPCYIMTALQDLEIRKLLTYLSDLERIIILAPTVNSLLTIFESIDIYKKYPVGIVSFSSVHEEQDQSDLALAQSLSFNDPQLEIRASEYILQRLRSHSRSDFQDHQPLIFEERPGKFKIWDVEENTVKHNIKKFGLLFGASQKENIRQPSFIDSGFSIFQLKIRARADDKINSKLNFRSTEIHYEGVMDFEVFLLLIDEINKLFESNDLKINLLRKIYMSTTWLANAVFLGEWLKKRLSPDAEVFYLEHCYGWNPLATCLQSMKETEKGFNLHIYLSPQKIYLSLTWI